MTLTLFNKKKDIKKANNINTHKETNSVNDHIYKYS